MVGTSTKIVAFVTVILALLAFVNTSVLTGILQAIILNGVNLQIVLTLLLLFVMLIGVLWIWKKGDQPPISKKRAEEIALAEFKKQYPDEESYWPYSKLTKLEGREWHVVGAFLHGGASKEQRFNIWIDCQNGKFERLSWN